MEEVLIIEGQIKVTKAAIKELKEDSYSYNNEIARLDKELSMAKV